MHKVLKNLKNIFVGNEGIEPPTFRSTTELIPNISFYVHAQVPQSTQQTLLHTWQVLHQDMLPPQSEHTPLPRPLHQYLACRADLRFSLRTAIRRSLSA